MTDPIDLTDDERRWADEIRKRLAEIKAEIRDRANVTPGAINEMGALAHKLHVSLKSRGREPRHNKHMLHNRRVAPSSEEFYNHVHPVEDLLEFLADSHANDDPVDLTLGHEFEFVVYSRRWGHPDTYKLTRIPTGWKVRHVDEVSTGRDGRVGGAASTGLFAIFDNDLVNYPADLPGYLEYLWERAADRGMSHEEVAAALDQLAEWVSTCEKASPAGVFAPYG